MTLINSIWLVGVEFIPPKRFYFPKIVNAICLINEGNFPIAHKMMFVILKVRVKWRLFDSILFNKTPWVDLQLLNVDRKPSVLPMLLWACFSWKKIPNIAGTRVQVIGLNTIFSLSTERSKCSSSHKIFAYFAHSTSKWSVTAFLLFKRCYLAITRTSFKLLALLNPIIGTFSKTFPCSLSGVNSKCISDSTFLSFRKTGWYVILKTSLLLFHISLHLFKTSNLENFLALRIWLLTNLSL